MLKNTRFEIPAVRGIDEDVSMLSYYILCTFVEISLNLFDNLHQITIFNF